MSYQQDSDRSEKAFMTICAAPLKEFFKAKEIISTSQHENKLAEMLDFAGVDILVDSAKFGLVPIQFKCSFGKVYRNFVIRRTRTSGSKTDLDKLTRAKAYGTIQPVFHCACFVDDDGNTDIALAATDDLMKFVADGQADIRGTSDGTFYTCDWQRLEKHGVKVFHLDRRADFQRRKIA